MSFSSIECLGVVLAGGLSTRMGTDKAMLSRNGESMLTRTKSLLEQANVDDVMISSNAHGVTDSITQMGPLGGIYTAIEKYQPNSLLILPVDLPFLTIDTVNTLLTKGRLLNKATYFQQHYLPLYLPNNAFSELFFQKLSHQKDRSLSSSEKSGPSIRALLQQIPHQALTLENEQQLFNANTPNDWQFAQQN